MRRIVTFGLCALALPMLATAQTKDDFAYWDANNNGDLTCSEAEDGPDGGLRLPAYQDDRDGTGIIYEWLERSRSRMARRWLRARWASLRARRPCCCASTSSVTSSAAVTNRTR